jgi:hypothetical protein
MVTLPTRSRAASLRAFGALTHVAAAAGAPASSSRPRPVARWTSRHAYSPRR